MMKWCHYDMMMYVGQCCIIGPVCRQVQGHVDMSLLSFLFLTMIGFYVMGKFGRFACCGSTFKEDLLN